LRGKIGRNNFKKNVGPVPTYCAAVRLDCTAFRNRNLTLTLTFDLFSCKIGPPVTPALGNVRSNYYVFLLFFLFELEVHTGRTDTQTDGQTSRQTDGRIGKTYRC